MAEVLDKQESSQNRMPIALMGKVYCKVDANYEAIKVNEAYMATWFYGLTHELGHVASHQLEISMRGGLFSDEAILDAFGEV